MTKRSEFFRAARSPEWLAVSADPTKPVDCTDDDPEVFSAYLNCVYFGAESITVEIPECSPLDVTSDYQNVLEYQAEQYRQQQDTTEDAYNWSRKECERRYAALIEVNTPYRTACHDHLFKLARVYLQADKLQDHETANSIIDAFVSVIGSENPITPNQEVINLIYNSTVHGHPFRKLLRDSDIYASTYLHYLRPHCANIVSDFYRDIYVDATRQINLSRPRNVLGSYWHYPVWDKQSFDKCHYHRHSNMVERCVPPVVYGDTPHSDEGTLDPETEW